jgi:hypothetical protein
MRLATVTKTGETGRDLDLPGVVVRPKKSGFTLVLARPGPNVEQASYYS